MKISLGPLLGLEGDYFHTVCFASTSKYSKQFLALKLKLDTPSDGHESEYRFQSRTKLEQLYFYRFTFAIPNRASSYVVKYHFEIDGIKLSTVHRRKSWEFEVAGKRTMPNIGFCSCNGDSKRHPSVLTGKDFVMWKKMRQHHQKPGERFHLLLMSGDQVYADSIWDRVPFLAGLKTRTISGSWRLTTRAVINRQLSQKESGQLTKELKSFYEQLYLSSWSNRDLSHMLASVPSVMMWDDHDIFDGWGSYQPKLQSSPVFKHIFPVAKKYFEIFQTRTKLNVSRESKSHFLQHLSYRNLEIIVLDNRSFRTTKQIMSIQQYKDLRATLQKVLFQSIPKENKSERILCFVVPVPIAHLKYSKIIQRMLPTFGRNSFRRSLNDDALDHWDHEEHEFEQKNLLELLFEAGERHNAKYVCIISGDVHTAGAATVTEGKRKLTQLISSGITHIAPNKWERGAIAIGTRSESNIACYNLKLKNFGNFKKFTINERNIGILTKAPHSGVIASLLIENRSNLAHRTLNKFK